MGVSDFTASNDKRANYEHDGNVVKHRSLRCDEDDRVRREHSFSKNGRAYLLFPSLRLASTGVEASGPAEAVILFDLKPPKLDSCIWHALP